MKYCEEMEALLDQFTDGELPPREMAEVQAHLNICPGCRAYVDDVLAIRSAFPDVEDTEVPDGFTAGVMAAIRADAAPQCKPRRPWRKVLAPLAACLAIVALMQIPSLQTAFQTGSSAAADTAAATSSAAASGGVEESESASRAAEGDPQETQMPALYAFDSGETDQESLVMDNTAPKAAAAAPEEGGAEEEGWVEYGNVVFSCTVYLTADYVGDALDGFEGKPYSNACLPEAGVMGTGYALEPADFERILQELEYPLGPTLNQDHTTELSCIIVTD